MSFKAKIAVNGKEYTVLSVSYELHQETDATGRPSSITRGGKIKVTIESTSDTSMVEWMMNHFERKNGTITYLKRDTDAAAKELNFTEGYMVRYKENFDSTGKNPMTESFILSCREISIGTGVFENPWVGASA